MKHHLLVVCVTSLLIANSASVFGIKEQHDGSGSHSLSDDRNERVLDKLPSDVKQKLTKGGKDAFKGIDKEVIKGLPGSVLASLGKEAIRSMDRTQLKEMTVNINNGTNSKDLEQILKDVDSDQFDEMLDDLKNSSRKFSKRQMEAFTRQMRVNKGTPSGWTASTVKQLGSMVKGLSPRELKELSSAGKQTFEASVEEISKSSVKELSKGQRKEIVRGAVKNFGSQDTWDAATVKKMSKFVGSMKHKDLKRIPTTALRGAMTDLANTEMNEKSSRELVKRLKDPTNGFGKPNSWTSDTLRSMGKLAAGLTVSDIKNLPRDAVRDALDTLGKTKLSQKQARNMASKVKDAFGSPDTWSADTIKNASNILRGLKPKDLKKLSAQAVRKSIQDLKKIKFSRGQAREIAKKVRESLGNPSQWSESDAEEMGPLVGGLPLSDLNGMSNVAIKSALKSLKEDDSVSPAKKRAIIKKAKAAGNLKLLEVGSFLETFTLKDLANIDPIVDLGLNETSDGNSTDDNDRAVLSWKLSQAREVLEKIRTEWGDPSDSLSSWTLENIVRLKGLAIGVWKSLVKDMPAHGFGDIVEEFSGQDGFTSGQVKMIVQTYKEKLNLNLPSNFSSLDEVEVEALGCFIGELPEEDLENLTPTAGAEAVRQIGQTDLKGSPRGLVKRKLKSAMRLLAKVRGEQDLTPDQLVTQEMEDLGNLAIGFTSEQLGQIKVDEFKDAIHSIGQTEGFDRDQLKVLVSKVKEAYKGSGSAEDAPSLLIDDTIHDIGNIMTGFTKEDFGKMDRHSIQEHIDFLGSLPLDREQAEGLMAQTTTEKRKRRETDLSAKTGDELIAMGNTLLALTAADIDTVTTAAFDDAAATIGDVKGFSRDQLEAWAAKAKEAWSSDVSSLTAEQLLKLGVIAVGFSDVDLQNMTLSSNDVIESMGSQPAQSAGVVGYTPSQLLSVLSRIKALKGGDIETFTGDDIAALKNFALAMTVNEMTAINDTSFSVAVSTLGGTSGWSKDQMVKLKEKSVTLYGALDTWTAAQLRESGAALGGFTSSELQALSSGHVNMISPTAITSMPVHVFSEFTVDQLKEFDSSQAGAVSDAQKAALSADKLDVLRVIEGQATSSAPGRIKVVSIISLFATILSLLVFFTC